MSLSSCSVEFAEKVRDAVGRTECPVPMEPFSPGEEVFLIGNGGSCAVASHIATDMMKFQKVPAHVLTDPAIMSCFANDYGYENALREAIARYIGVGGIGLICISSSGRSKNIIKAAAFAQSRGAYVVTFTGFDADNPLRAIGDCNYWVPSHNYGVVEIAHLTILHSIVNPGE